MTALKNHFFLSLSFFQLSLEIHPLPGDVDYDGNSGENVIVMADDDGAQVRDDAVVPAAALLVGSYLTRRTTMTATRCATTATAAAAGTVLVALGHAFRGLVMGARGGSGPKRDK